MADTARPCRDVQHGVARAKRRAIEQPLGDGAKSFIEDAGVGLPAGRGRSRS